MNGRRCPLAEKLLAVELIKQTAFAAVFVGHGEDLAVKLLKDERDHEKGVGVFFRHDDENRRLLRAEFLGIDLGAKAQKLLKLRIKECVQARKRRGHDARHGLIGAVERGSGEPFGLVVIGQLFHELLELILAFRSRWCQ